jgi:hypothetical protein
LTQNPPALKQRVREKDGDLRRWRGAAWRTEQPENGKYASL